MQNEMEKNLKMMQGFDQAHQCSSSFGEVLELLSHSHMEVASALSTLQPLTALTPRILSQQSFGDFEREAEAVDSDQ